MKCLINQGIVRGCKDNMGGLLWAIGINYANGEGIDSVNLGITQDSEPIAAGVVTSIKMSNGKVGFKYVSQKNTSSYTDTSAGSKETGTSSWKPVLNLSFAKHEASKRNQILFLSRGETTWIVKDRNDRFWLLGFHNGMEITPGENIQSGVQAADLNGIKITLEGEERVPAYEIFITDVATTEAMIVNSVLGGSGSGSGFGI